LGSEALHAAPGSTENYIADTDTIGFLIFVAVLAITFIAGKLSER
jgi:hypothetical protein